jgi:hypothetical protein
MAFGDVFLVLTLLFMGLAMFALVLRRPPEAPAPGGGH